MKMTILERDDDITHVILSGRLDTTGTEEIGERFSAATSAREQSAVVDLAEIDFLASRGIGLLFANGKGLMKSGRKMVLLKPQEMVESVLKTSKVDKVMPIAHDLGEAIRILGGDPSQSSASSPAVPAARPVSPSAAPTVSSGAMKVAIKNELTELDGLNATLAQFLTDHGVPYRATYAVNLAIDELVVNVMRYAYVDDETHLINIELVVEGDQLILRIVDDGRPFDPRRGPSLDLHAEDREAGGLGLILVLDVVDMLRYRRIDETNWVEVRVHLIAEEENSDLPAAEGAASETTKD